MSRVNLGVSYCLTKRKHNVMNNHQILKAGDDLDFFTTLKNRWSMSPVDKNYTELSQVVMSITEFSANS